MIPIRFQPFKAFCYFFLLLCASTVLLSCSQDSTSFVARNYHDLLARDNPFFLARERMKDVELKVYNMKKDDYNNILHPIPPFDTLQTKTLQAQLDDIIKKASMPIRRHKNSKYVDDSYILVGRCRMYKGEFKLGADTYKYVNAQSKDADARHEALIYLLRAYMAWNQYDNAKPVVDFLDKQELNPKNKAEYNVTKAEYLRHFEQYEEMIPLLVEAAPALHKRDLRSRMYFILGQLYQQSGNDTLAYTAYRKVAKSNPPYDMLFMAKLNMYQVASLGDEKDTKKIKRYYAKLLKDGKNLEYKDKIYYEMALFEYKQKNYPEAVTDLKLSAKASTGGYQKGFTFLKLAEIYYDDLEDYENAASYYDSTAGVFDKKDKRFPLIQKRNKILGEFIRHIKTIKVEDSLQLIAAMDSTSRNALIDSLIAKEQDDYMKQQIALRKKKNQDNEIVVNTTNIAGQDPSSASWYFNNAKAMQEGVMEFTNKWGKRKLEDNWRRSRKEAVIEFNPDTSANGGGGANNVSSASEDDEIQPLKIDRNKYIKDLPLTDEQKAASDTKIEDAMFQVANIYNHKLDEPDRAIRTYEQLLKRFPKTAYEPEILYNLYLIYKEKNNIKYDTYKNILFDKYPNSIYSKLIRNPNYYKDNRIANQQADIDYKEVFNLYKAASYSSSDSLASIMLSKYPDSNVADKLTYIKLLCKLKTAGPSAELVNELNNFILQYPDSPLIPNAKELIKTIEKLKPDATPKTP